MRARTPALLGTTVSESKLKAMRSARPGRPPSDAGSASEA
jgi:hypothetical protein